MSTAIAVVGMACRFPDASSPEQLWENVLAQRRAFRRLPPERLHLGDYLSADPHAADAVYAAEAALLEGYEFDRTRFKVAGSIFRAVDHTHWLALDVADQALRDAGYPEGRDLPRESTGVLVGNTLTGEFSRAAMMRVRWPYVRRVVEDRLAAEGWEHERRRGFLKGLEDLYKRPFPPVDEETLAGGLSNTIAGRICNHFHLGGGGYTLDGACSSSLLAVARACSALEAGEIDAALVGGVDLSLDPFELVGFSKAGALARGDMKVYDQESTGFLPGEGCGFVLLLRAEDARQTDRRCYGLISGWGISSDGGGSITRPEARGQQLAVIRAHRRAGYGPDSVSLFEGHGTGTPVGDEVELEALSAARRMAATQTAAMAASPAVIGSVKANIGHTKAAAGIAGLIKATLAVHHQVLPPTTGVRTPRPELEGKDAVLRVLKEGQPWITERRRAGVSSFGFGGINVHVTMEGSGPPRTTVLSARERRLLASAQDAEVFLFQADDPTDLALQLERLAWWAPRLSRAEMADVAAALVHRRGRGPVRAGIVASTRDELERALGIVAAQLAGGASRFLDRAAGVFLGAGCAARVALLFPGQGSPVHLDGGILARRFAVVRDLYVRAALPVSGDLRSTALAQPALATAMLAGSRLLEALGIRAEQALGHSLGELAALAWSGAFDDGTLLELATVRGRLMSDVPGPPGGMATLGAGSAMVRELVAEAKEVAIACLNSPRQTVVSGERESVLRVASKARARGWPVHVLPTSHAFHSPLMLPAQEPFHRELRARAFGTLGRRVVSTVTARPLDGAIDLPDLLTRQLTEPVRFEESVAQLLGTTDLCLEVGSGEILSHMVAEIADVPVISLDVGGASMRGVLEAAAAVFALGGQIRVETLFDDRFSRPFDLDRQPRFLVNPCERAPRLEPGAANVPKAEPRPELAPAGSISSTSAVENPLEWIRELVARRVELPLAAVRDESRLLQDLHLNSLAASELVAAAARHLRVPPPAAPLSFADATVAEVARSLERLQAAGVGLDSGGDAAPPGVDRWVRAFAARRTRARGHGPRRQGPGSWRVCSAPGHPLAEAFRERASDWPGRGVLVCLSAGRVEDQVPLLLEGAGAILRAEGPDRCLSVFQPEAVAGSFARTLHLENPEITTCVIEAPMEAHALDWVEEEVRRASGHSESFYDEAGRRQELGIELLCLGDEERERFPLEPGEVVLVSGGGKGISAECARELARQRGVTLALLGRSLPEQDDELSRNLRRLSDEGVHFRYFPVDVTHGEAVGEAVSAVETELGPVVAILHGAGSNRPALLRNLSQADFERTLAPKLQGFRNLVAAADPEGLRLLVTFGSVIGRIGMHGEADYALANSALTLLCREYQASHPLCRCVALESSVWADVGMGERLGRIDALRHQGITAITPEEGTSLFLRLIAREHRAQPVIVAGRLGATSPLPLPAASLPLFRFLEKPRVHYPGIELVIEAEVSTATDPYLMEHVFEGQPLLPAVIGLEAMVQVAMAVLEETTIPTLEHVRFDHPIVVDADSAVTLRLAALVREPGRVDVTVRSSKTGFHVDHFSCECRFAPRADAHAGPPALPGPSRVPLDPQQDLYGPLLFQGGRFQRVAGYRHLTASYSCAEIASAPEQGWFSQYLPGARILGDPAARDAALHSIQACVPHAVLLPVGVDRMSPVRLSDGEAHVAYARERWREGDSYVYDLELCASDGRLLERWEGVHLRRVADATPRAWPDALLGPFVEWKLRDLVPGSRVLVALERSPVSSPRVRSDRVIQKALGSERTVLRRHDGRPWVDGQLEVSASHAEEITLAVAAATGVTCDVEPVRGRGASRWQELLGSDRWGLAQEIARQAGENLDQAATRVWVGLECVKKADAPWNAPLLVLTVRADGWVCLGTPGGIVATYVATLQEHDGPLVLGVLVSQVTCAATNTVTA